MIEYNVFDELQKNHKESINHHRECACVFCFNRRYDKKYKPENCDSVINTDDQGLCISRCGSTAIEHWKCVSPCRVAIETE